MVDYSSKRSDFQKVKFVLTIETAIRVTSEVLAREEEGILLERRGPLSTISVKLGHQVSDIKQCF